VQGWVAGTTSNYGLTIQNYSGSDSTGLAFNSSENDNASYRPKLNINYCVPAPEITTTGTLSPFSAAVGAPSAEQSYTVAGNYLTANLVVTAPTHFEVTTTSGSGYASSVSLVPSGGTVPATPIYVRFNPSAAGTFNSNITNASSGATTQNVAVSGVATANHAPVVTNPGDQTDVEGIIASPCR
jgi:hypothetical protein